ncbi:MAG TPA: serine hydrolase [Fulvivirga sp.]|nr:serine hydrolase [Fulvivirga sp.]
MTRKFFSVIVSIFLTQLSQAQVANTHNQWADSVFQSLTMEQHIGQLFLVPVYSNGTEQEHEKIESIIQKYEIGGLVFMDNNVNRQIELINRFQKISTVPLLIAADNGLNYSATKFPNQLALGAIDKDSLNYRLGLEQGRQMKLTGINMSLSPSVLIGDQSFTNVLGDSPALVGRKGLAMMKGLQENGLLTCTTFFPGIYDDGLINNRLLDKKNIQETSITPFLSLINNNTDAIMVSHAITSLDNKNIPSSLSETTINVLKKNLKFNGLIISDDFNKKIIQDKYHAGKAEALSFAAGVDMLITPDVSASIKSIKKLLKRKKVSLGRLNESATKILTLKANAGIVHPKEIVVDNLFFKLSTPTTKLINQELYRQSVTIARDVSDVIPIKILDEKSFASLSIGEGKEFTETLDKYTIFSHYNLSRDYTRLEKNLPLYDYVVIGVFNENWNESTVTLINKLSLKTNVILCSFINPYKLREFYGVSSLVVAYNADEEYQKVVPQIIFGSLPALGKLPVSISSDLPNGTGIVTHTLDRLAFGLPEEVGMDSKILRKIDKIAIEAIKGQDTPGCQILVARNGKIILNKSYGYYTYDSITPVDDHTIYDIASITKVAATTQAIMFLEERGVIDLDKKASLYLPELRGTNKENMILRDILTHQAGLWPFLPFWKQVMSDTINNTQYMSQYRDSVFSNQVSDGLFGSELMRDSLWQWVKDSKLRTKEYRKPYDYKYSDMGYYLLLKIIEKNINQPLEEFLQQNFYDPLGLSTLSYLPLCKYPLSLIAPTEYDNYFRKTLVDGLVHDQGAAMLGGVAGHAGLFSNALDLAKLMQMNLQDGHYGGSTYFMKGTVERFTSQQYESNRRGIGWDKPVLGEWNSPTSRFASGKTFGHSGFTGTAVWVDPEFQLVYVFLSNRIYPDAENRKLIKNNIRTRIQDLIYQSIWSYSAVHCVDYINK